MDDQSTYTWVADAGSARAAADSFARGALRQRRSRVMLAVAWLVVVLAMWTSLDGDLDPVARLLWAFAYGTVFAAFTLGIGILIGRRLTRRRFAERLTPGTELTSRFSPTSVFLSGPLSRHDLSYDGLVHVERIEGWVHLRQLGSPVSLVWPGELFPDTELDRMRAAIAEHSH